MTQSKEELKDVQEEDSKVEEDSKAVAVNSAKIVTEDSVEAEDVPTIPLGSLQTIGALQPEIAVHSTATTSDVSVPTPLVAQLSGARRSQGEWFRLWWDGMRPAYLPLSLMPVLLGSLLAWSHTVSTQAPLGRFRITFFLAALLTVALLQIGANLVNDYYDYLSGVDTGNTLGPGGLIQQGLIRPTRVLTVGLCLLGLGVLGGLFVAAAGGPLVYLFGLIGLLGAYFYSATARSLSSLALGEAVGFLLFGPLITLGAYMVQGQQLSWLAFLYSLPLGLWAAATIHLNDMRDAESDAQVGKRTLAVILGLYWSRVWFLALLAATYIVILMLAVPHGTPHLLLISLWTLPALAITISGVLRTDTMAGLHLAMLQLLRLEVYFSVLLVIALLVATLYPVLPLIPATLLQL